MPQETKHPGAAGDPAEGAADAERQSTRIVLSQVPLTIGRVQALLNRIPAPTRGGPR